MSEEYKSIKVKKEVHDLIKKGRDTLILVGTNKLPQALQDNIKLKKGSFQEVITISMNALLYLLEESE